MSDELGGAQPQRVSFAQMLTGRYFVIPDYQRHYAWTQRQCRELFDDCVTAARSGRERFMSTITAIAPAGNSIYKTYIDTGYDQLKPLLVVDGQQRLTSILVLISCICRKLSNDFARNAYTKLVSTPLSDGKELLRVIPQSIPAKPELMRDFFSDLVNFQNKEINLKEPIYIPAQRRLVKARETFEEGLADLDDPDLPPEERVSPEDLLTCVLSRLVFILTTLSDVGQAGEVFEGLNNRGLALSTIENLKAFSIYAVQTFRKDGRLPGTMPGTPSDLNDDFNDAIGTVYHRLDRVNLSDDKAARDFLTACWPVVSTRVKKAGLGKDGTVIEHLDRSAPVDGIRASLFIQKARRDDQRMELLGTLRFMICDTLVPASLYFAEARRPMNEFSFENVRLSPEQVNELKGLHQRLVEMQCTAPFLPVMIAHRVTWPDDAHDYLLLIRLIERVAFWVYVLAGRSKGTGQKLLAYLAQILADGELDFRRLLLSLRVFALSGGRSTDDESEWGEEHFDFDSHMDDALVKGALGVSAASAYEWLLSKKVELPSYGKFVRSVVDEKSLYIIPRGVGRLPAGYSLKKSDVCVAGNIVITRLTGKISASDIKEFDKLNYSEKLEELKNYGYNVGLPKDELTSQWADKQKRAITALAKRRWAIPQDGRIANETFTTIDNQEFEEPPEDLDS